MKTMIRLILSFLILIYANLLFSQELVLRKSSEGYCLLFDRIIPKNGISFQVERKAEDEKKFQVMYSIKAPESFEGLSSNYLRYLNDFGVYSDNRESMVELLWDNIRKSDTLFARNALGLAEKLAVGSACYDSLSDFKKDYLYKVTLFDKNGNALFKKTLSTEKDLVISNLESPKKLFVSGTSKNIRIKWYVSKNENIYDFKVYRRLVKDKDAEQMTLAPTFVWKNDTLVCLVNDTSMIPFEMYEYSIRLRDNCYFEGPQSEKLLANSVSKLELPTAENIKIKGITEKRAVELSWDYPQQDILVAFQIFRSRTIDGNYRNIATVLPEQRSYVDILSEANENYYYFIIADTRLGYSYPSIKVFGLFEGKDKPEPPQGLAVFASDSNVMLKWEAGENFVKGYYVFRTEGISGQLRQISEYLPKTTPLMHYIDKDTLRGNMTYFYAVKAQSDGFIQSDLSEKVTYRKKSKEVPHPDWVRIKKQDKGNMILWDNLIIRYDFVVNYAIYIEYKGTESLLSTVTGDRNYYIDTLTRPLGTKYVIYAINNDNSKSLALTSDPMDQKTELPCPSGILAIKQKSGVLLQFNPVLGVEIGAYRIYRVSEEETERKTITDLTVDKNSFLDKTVKDGKLYMYQVVSVDKNGNEGENPGEVIIRL